MSFPRSTGRRLAAVAVGAMAFLPVGVVATTVVADPIPLVDPGPAPDPGPVFDDPNGHMTCTGSGGSHSQCWYQGVYPDPGWHEWH